MVISTSLLRRLRGALAGIALAVTAYSGEAAPVSLPGSLPNMVGLGVGSTTEFAGGKDRMIGVVPGVRYVTPGGRLLEWYGPYAQFNFGGLTGFQWGPAVGLRLGRNNVDDAMVAQLPEIDTTVEAGGYIGYEYLNPGRIPWRLRGGINVMTNGGIVYGGSRVTATGTFWMPLHRRAYAGMGLGATWVSGSFNRTYFGVTPAGSAASGLPTYSPGGGLEQLTGWLAMIYQFDKHWYGGAMLYVQRLTGDAADSPIVTQRGTRNQITYGIGLAYAWH
ncbi:MipA/OmpV family protein [Cupriavidus sp. NPDC089707]|uniref:MipA/OmpV family protein n=1 Tax=Cupriavidus sp. NPDC089707 TaxID=3363963 RepID=UPI0037F8D892